MDRTLCCSEGGTAGPVVDTLGCMVPMCTWIQVRLREYSQVFVDTPPECQKPYSMCLLEGVSGLTPPLIETKGDTIYSAGWAAVRLEPVSILNFYWYCLDSHFLPSWHL